MKRRRPIIAFGCAAAAAGLIAGCGFGASPRGSSATLLVTGDFGAHRIGADREKPVPASESVLGLLKRHFRVVTAATGSVVAIDGLRAGTGGRSWLYFVNGIAPTKGALSTPVSPGDHVWWDLHSTVGSSFAPAVVGSYPEPFTSGLGGKELPTLLNCAAGMQGECDLVGASLRAAGVKAADQEFGTGSGSDSLAVVIGTWSQVHGIIAAELIAAGPSQSGVYAQFVGAQGAALELDAPDGSVVGTLRGDVGLIAATGNEKLGQPTWFVTGTDRAGVMAAAREFTAAKLDGHFAVAVTGSRVISLPVDAAR